MGKILRSATVAIPATLGTPDSVVAVGPKSEAIAAPERATEKFLQKLSFTTSGYTSVQRTEKKYFKDVRGLEGVFPLVGVSPQRGFAIGKISLRGKVGRFGIDGPTDAPKDVRIAEMRAGKIERGLRFKPITDVVERRYNLPPGILMAMLVQESSGMDLLPNGQNDGGIGLVHMQPKIAAEFGLKTLDDNTKMVDTEHGAHLRDLIKEKNNDVFALAEEDERFNRLLNIDAAGRMLAGYMAAPPVRGYDHLESALMRYAGAPNYLRGYYRTAMRTYLRLLHDEAYIAEIAHAFDERNKDLVINGKKVVGKTPFQAYLEMFWEENEKGFNLKVYRDLPAFKPTHSDEVIKMYRSFFESQEAESDDETIPLPPERPE